MIMGHSEVHFLFLVLIAVNELELRDTILELDNLLNGRLAGPAPILHRLVEVESRLYMIFLLSSLQKVGKL